MNEWEERYKLLREAIRADDARNYQFSSHALEVLRAIEVEIQRDRHSWTA